MASVESVLPILEEACGEAGLTMQRRSASTQGTSFLGSTGCMVVDIEVRSDSVLNDATLLRFRSEPTQRIVHRSQIVLGLGTLLVLLGIFIFTLERGPGLLVFTSVVILVGGYYCASNVHQTEESLLNEMHSTISAINERIRTEFELQQVSPILKPSVVGKTTSMMVDITLVVGALFAIGPILALWLLLVLPTANLRRYIEQRQARHWQSALVNLYVAWSRVCVCIICAGFLVMLSTVGHRAMEYQLSDDTKLSSAIELFDLVNAEFLGELKGDDAERSSASVQAETISQSLEDSLRSRGSPMDLERTLFIFRLVVGLVSPLVTTALLFGLITETIATESKNWSQSMSHLERDSRALVTFPSIASTEPSAPFGTWAIAGPVWLVHAASVLLSVEIGLFYAIGYTPLINGLGVSLALFDVNASAILGKFLGQLLAHMLALLLAAPGAVAMAVTLIRLTSIGVREIVIWFHTDSNQDETFRKATDYIAKNCSGHFRRIPRLNIQKGPRCELRSEAALIGSATRIDISPSLLENLSPDEWRVLLRHEFYHLRCDAKRLKRLRLVSALLLCPFPYTLTLYRFDESERAADAFAADSRQSAQALISALVKLSVMKSVVDPSSQPATGLIYRIREIAHRIATHRLIRNASPFLEGTIIGSAYPSIQERISWLQRHLRERASVCGQENHICGTT